MTTTDGTEPATASEKLWYQRGALNEAAMLRDRMSDDGRRVYDYVRVSAKQGRSADHIVESTAKVFTTEWPLHRRVRLSWRLIRNR